MRRVAIVLVTALLLSVPPSAYAGLLGYGQFKPYWSEPTGGGYYLDYDGEVIGATSFGYTLGLSEIFCVSGQSASTGVQEYAFYDLTTPGLPNGVDSADLLQAAWIADNWMTFSAPGIAAGSDAAKAEAQKAIWVVMGVMDITGGSGLDWEIYQASIGKSSTNWYLAYSPGRSGGDYQDYLVPIPEPASLLLLGAGLTGLGVLRRRRSQGL